MKSYKILFLVVLFVFNLTFSQSWQRINSPTGGTILSMAVDKNDILYAGTPYDGVYKSTDHGANWSHLGIANIKPVYGIATNSSGTIFLLTSNNSISNYVGFPGYNGPVTTNNIYKSTDGGGNFTGITISVGGTDYSKEDFIAVGVDGSGTVYLSTSSSIFYSTDNGTTWVRNASGPQRVFSFLAATNGKFYASTAFNQIYSTNNNGQSWSMIKDWGYTTGQYLNSFTVSKSGTLLCTYGYQYPDVYRSTDNGTNWQKYQDGVNTGSKFLCSDNQGALYLNYLSWDGISRSTDDGMTWNNYSFPTSFHCWADAMNGFVIDSGRNIFVGTQASGVAKSVDLGITWTQSANGINSMMGRYFNATPSGTLFFDQEGTGYVYRSTNGGTTWGPWYGSSSQILQPNSGTYINASLSTLGPGGLGGQGNNELIRTNGNTLYSQGGNKNNVLISTDEGNSWKAYIIDPQDYSGGGYPSDFAFGANGIIYMSSYFGIYKSTTGGTTWSLQTPSYGNLTIQHTSIVINPKTGTIFSTGDSPGMPYYSNDGVTWNKWDSGSGYKCLKVNNTGAIFAQSTTNLLDVSNDNGVTFKRIYASGIDDWLIDNSGKIILATVDGVFYSTDNGTSWQSNNTNLPWGGVIAVSNDNSGIAYATSNAGLYKITNLAVTTYTVATSSNPTAGGATSGGGTVNSGSNVTVKAIANTGYTFTNWTEGNTVVSTSASFTFTVTGNRTLVANFIQNAAAVNIKPTTATTTIPKGTSFWVDVKVGDPTALTDLYGVSFRISSNNSSCTIVDGSAKAGDFLGSSVLFFPQKIDAQTLDVAVSKTSAPGVNGSGVVASIQFTSATTITSDQTVVFTLSNLSANNSQGTVIPLAAATLSVTISATSTVNVWPGDTNNDGIVSTADLLPIGLYYGQNNGSTGATPNGPGIAWQTYARQPWTADGASPKKIYVDANGDGTINATDLLAIGINYGKTHTSGSIVSASIIPSEEKTINKTLANSSIKIVIPAKVKNNTNFTVQVTVGDPVAVADLYGVSFRIKSSSATCNYLDNSAVEGSFLGSSILKIFQKIDNQTVDAAVSKISTPGVNGSGVVAAFNFNSTVDQTVSFSLSNVSANDSKGNTIPLDVTTASISVDVQKEETIPTETKLSQNYPNPFNPTSVISYQIKEPGMVSLKVYDVLGREVITLVNEEKQAGKYEINLNGSELTSGVYFYKLQTGKYTDTKKFVLLK